jgi:hypothetical protein
MWSDVLQILAGVGSRLHQLLLALLPALIAALVVVGLGVAIGLGCGRLARRFLAASGFDQEADRFGIASSLATFGIWNTVSLAAKTLQWIVILTSALIGISILSPAVAEELARRFLMYLPNLVVAGLTLAGGALLARYLGRSALIAAVNAEIRPARALSAITRAGVMIVAVAVAMEQLAIGRATALTVFAILLGGAVLTAALALGSASRDSVQRWLEGRRPQAEEEESLHHW